MNEKVRELKKLIASANVLLEEIEEGDDTLKTVDRAIIEGGEWWVQDHTRTYAGVLAGARELHGGFKCEHELPPDARIGLSLFDGKGFRIVEAVIDRDDRYGYYEFRSTGPYDCPINTKLTGKKCGIFLLAEV